MPADDNRHPTFSDPAGFNYRNISVREHTVVIKGGTKNNFVLFRKIPVVQIALGLQMSIQNFFADTFIVSMATLLRVDRRRIKVASVSKANRRRKLMDSEATHTHGRVNEWVYSADSHRMTWVSARSGLHFTEEEESINVNMDIQPAVAVVTNYSAGVSQVAELQDITSVFSAAVTGGSLATTLNVSIMSLTGT